MNNRPKNTVTMPNGGEIPWEVRFSANPVTGENGVLMNIHKDLIHLAGYQREVKKSLINQIARDFSFLKCQPLTISKREGKYWCVDGQHRWEAAMKRLNVTHLPCIVHEGLTESDEADLFLAINDVKAIVKAGDKFKAQVCSGAEEAIKLQSMLDKYGFKSNVKQNGPRNIRCVRLLQDTVRSYGFDFLDEVLHCVFLTCEDYVIDNITLKALIYINRFCETGLSDRKMSDRLHELGWPAIQRGALSGAASYGGNHAKAFALGVLDALNHKRKNRFMLKHSGT